MAKRVAILLLSLLLLAGCAGAQEAASPREEAPEKTAPPSPATQAAAESEADAHIEEAAPTAAQPQTTPEPAPAEEKPEEGQKKEETDMTEFTGTLAEDEIRVLVGDRSFLVRLEDNASAAALRELLQDGDRTIPASNYGGFEKVCRLGTRLPAQDERISTAPGDVMLYSGDQIVFFYASNSWAYTRLGRVEELGAEELEQILGGPETEITLSIR